MPNTIITPLHDGLYQLSATGNRCLPCYLRETLTWSTAQLPIGPLWFFDNDDNTDLFSYTRVVCRRLAVRLCPGHLRPSGLLCRSPLFGGTACQQTYEILIGRCSQLERWIAKLLFLPRGHTTADASKSTCERTLRGCFRSVQLFNLLCNYTCTIWGFFCLTLVCLVTDGCIQLVSTSACFVTRWETPSVSCGKSWVIFCLCWAPAPFLLLLRCCFPWRNANLAGGFAGRLPLRLLFFCSGVFV